MNTSLRKVAADRLSLKLKTATVIMPDFYSGFPILMDIPWLPNGFIKYNFVNLPQIVLNCKFRITDEGLVRDLLDLLFPWIQKQTGKPLRVSCDGFCFDGWLVGHTLALSKKHEDDKDFLMVYCGVGMHPSFKIEIIHGRKQQDLAMAIGDKPILLLPASNDDLKPQQHEAIRILAEARGVPQEEVAIEFPHMIHGWVNRGNPERRMFVKRKRRRYR